MKELKLIEQNGCDDNLTAKQGHDGRMIIEVEEPWSGDTSTGFGRSGAIQLEREQVVQLIDFLGEWLSNPKD